MAEQGMGIAYLPDFAINRQLREGVLVTVLDDYTDRSGPLRVIWPSIRHLAPKLRVFVVFLASNLVPVVEGEEKRAGVGEYWRFSCMPPCVLGALFACGYSIRLAG